MGGVLGFVTREPRGIALNVGSATLRHHETFRQGVFVNSPRLGLAAVYRDNDPPRSIWLADAKVGVVVYGHALLPTRPATPADAKRVAWLYLDQGLDALFTLDGEFLVAILDLGKEELLLLNDRMATIPTQYLCEDGTFIVAPEAKAIFAMLGRRPALDTAGVLSFLNLGFALGSRTIVENVTLVEPAQIVTVSLKCASVHRRTYWTLRFFPQSGMKMLDATEALRSAVDLSHDAALADQPSRVQLLLTGGFDSRLILGSLLRAGRPPDECLTWGVDPEIPNSDLSAARALAQALGVSWRGVRYDGSTFVDHAIQWAVVSELASDNLGNFAAGHDFLYRTGAVAPAVFIGDQMLGTGGLPLSRADAIEAVSGLPRSGVSVELAKILHPGCVGEVERLQRLELEKLAEACPNDAPKDLQDFLGLHIRLARWLNAPTYFREPMVSPRRPLLMRPMVELFTLLPAQLRVDKRVLVRMLQQEMRELMRIPRSSAHNLVDWDRLFTGDTASGAFFRETCRDETLLERELHGLVDPARLRSSIEHYVTHHHTPIARKPSRVPGGLPALRRAASSLPWLARSMRVAERAFGPTVDRARGATGGRVVQRYALLALFRRGIEGSGHGQVESAATDQAKVGSGTWPLRRDTLRGRGDLS